MTIPTHYETIAVRLDLISAQLASMDTKLDVVADLSTRHDEQIKTIQRGGGSLLAFALTLIAGLVKDRLHL